MANTVKIKRSAVASKVPLTTDLELGELAVNTYDGKLFLKKDNGTASIVEIGAGSGMTYPGAGIANSTGTAWGTSYSTTGSGTVVALATSPTFATDITAPLVIGGTTASSSLILQSTSGAGTSDSIAFKVGNNGATTAMFINNSGNIGINTASPDYLLDLTARTNAIAMQIRGRASDNLALILFNNNAGNAASEVNYIASDTNGYLAFATNNTDRVTIDASGNLGVGTSPVASTNLLVQTNIQGATTAFGISESGSVQSAVTIAAIAFNSSPKLAASAFTAQSLIHFYANPAAGGVGSTINNQTGFMAEDTLRTAGGATVNNSYGFYGNIASGSNRWNLYMGGTALNYMAGGLGIGTTSLGGTGLTTSTIWGGTGVTSSLTLQSTSGAGEGDSIAFKVGNNGATTAMFINGFGSVGVGTTSPVAQLDIYTATGAVDLRVRSGTTQLFLSANGGSGDVGTYSNTALKFKTNSIERFEIGTSGQLGIGGSNYGSAGQVLTSNGSSAAPSWQAAGGGEGAGGKIFLLANFV